MKRDIIHPAETEGIERHSVQPGRIFSGTRINGHPEIFKSIVRLNTRHIQREEKGFVRLILNTARMSELNTGGIITSVKKCFQDHELACFILEL